MFRKKVIIIMYETSEPEGGRGTFYASGRLFSYGTLYEVALEKLTEKYGSGNFLVTNVIKL